MRQYAFRTLNAPVDVSQEFNKLENVYFNALRLASFDPKTGTGAIQWKRQVRQPYWSFNQLLVTFQDAALPEFPPDYERDPVLPFLISFISPRAVRLRLSTRADRGIEDEPSLMLQGQPPRDDSWELTDEAGAITYRSASGSVTIERDHWRVVFRDAAGRLLTQTQHPADTKCLQNSDPTPFSFARLGADWGQRLAASFAIAPDEGFYGCGESFTRLNKRGQKVTLCAHDAHGAQVQDMYKPIPFFMSSRGYGMFVHSTTPMTFDFGHYYDGANVLYLGDDYLDLFFFFGSPKEILTEYTALTGRSPVPPLWSFGLWMSRITYQAEDEVRSVAQKLREQRIPCDVIHIDTGWFEQDWRCDYEFSKARFQDPKKMISDLKDQGFRVCLWQLPYFTPKNRLFGEIVKKGLTVRDADGKLPTEDAILDFSNPKTVKWYQDRLAGLLKMGVGAIKVDFGEAAPLQGQYASGKSGFYEHNLYPLRYNKAAAEITHDVTGEWIIWARSTWAGSQRYPLHWGGDAENTDCAMSASLRAGLSLGLCGFSFWSHDIGGFVQAPPPMLYRRWMPFGMLTSHSRCHGAPPKEPWPYGEAFTDNFRRATELKYRLMPYIYAQAHDCSERGLPMLRALFLEYPDDPTCWLIEDEYLFGRDLLAAPLMEEITARKVYLPPGAWLDYQTGETYDGGRWHTIAAGDIPIVLLVREGAAIPHIPLAQSTAWMDWGHIELQVYTQAEAAEALVCLPDENKLHSLRLQRAGRGYELVNDPCSGRVAWSVRIMK